MQLVPKSYSTVRLPFQPPFGELQNATWGINNPHNKPSLVWLQDLLFSITLSSILFKNLILGGTEGLIGKDAVIEQGGGNTDVQLFWKLHLTPWNQTPKNYQRELYF